MECRNGHILIDVLVACYLTFVESIRRSIEFQRQVNHDI